MSPGLAGQSVPQRPPMISMEVERLMKGSEILHNIVTNLENRLSAIVRPEGQSPVGQSEKQTGSNVAMVDALASLNARLEHACARLNSLTDRVEL